MMDHVINAGGLLVQAARYATRGPTGDRIHLGGAAFRLQVSHRPPQRAGRPSDPRVEPLRGHGSATCGPPGAVRPPKAAVRPPSANPSWLAAWRHTISPPCARVRASSPVRPRAAR